MEPQSIYKTSQVLEIDQNSKQTKEQYELNYSCKSHSMKGEEKDDDSELNLTNEITQLLVNPRETTTTAKLCWFSMDALKEMASPREFFILQFYLKNFEHFHLQFYPMLQVDLVLPIQDTRCK